MIMMMIKIKINRRIGNLIWSNYYYYYYYCFLATSLRTCTCGRCSSTVGSNGQFAGHP